jgi:hypothetical protein
MKDLAEKHPILCGSLVLLAFIALLAPQVSLLHLVWYCAEALLIALACGAAATIVYGVVTAAGAAGRKGILAVLTFFKRSAKI